MTGLVCAMVGQWPVQRGSAMLAIDAICYNSRFIFLTDLTFDAMVALADLLWFVLN